MSTVSHINRKTAKFPPDYRPARPIIVAFLNEPDPRKMQDFATPERKAYVRSVDPCISRQERRQYFWRSVLAVITGGPMPYERVS